MSESKFNWVDNPTASGQAICDTDVLNECLMHLKYDNSGGGGLENKITNCITEIPQRIKLELKDGVLTLKAGSQIIVPNGFEADGTTPKFDEVIIESDISRTWNSGAYTLSAFLRIVNGEYSTTSYSQSADSSGSTEPTTSSSFYNTSTNTVYRYNGSAKGEQMSFPLAIVTSDANGYASIDQVFNGIGYIGSYIWKDEDLVGLSPNGYNNDGTLSNIEWKTDKVTGRQLSGTGTYALFTSKDGSFDYVPLNTYELTSNPSSTCRRYYNPNDNYIYSAEDDRQMTGYIYAGTCTIADGKITSFDVKKPFRAMDYNEVKDYIKSERYDGQWIYKTLELTTATAIGTYTIDLSSYLPNDSYNYEVIVTAAAYSAGSSGALTSFKSDLVNSNMYLTYTNTNARHDANTIIIPVSKTKKIYYVIAKANVEHHGAPTALAYRRIGTNL